jgi:flagellar secretion chaperone FliS
MPLSNQQKKYVAQRVQAATPVELIRLLYETALQSVEEALRAQRSGDILGRGRAVTRTIEILSELRSALRFDVQQEYCSTLAGLYGYMQGQLIRAHAEQSAEFLEEVSRLLQTLLAGWTGAMANLAAEQETSAAAEVDRTGLAPSDPNPYSDGPASPDSLVRSWQL